MTPGKDGANDRGEARPAARRAWPAQMLQAKSPSRGKGDSPHLCEAPSGPFRQMGTVPFSLPLQASRTWVESRPVSVVAGENRLTSLRKTARGKSETRRLISLWPAATFIVPAIVAAPPWSVCGVAVPAAQEGEPRAEVVAGQLFRKPIPALPLMGPVAPSSISNAKANFVVCQVWPDG